MGCCWECILHILTDYWAAAAKELKLCLDYSELGAPSTDSGSLKLLRKRLPVRFHLFTHSSFRKQDLDQIVKYCDFNPLTTHITVKVKVLIQTGILLMTAVMFHLEHSVTVFIPGMPLPLMVLAMMARGWCRGWLRTLQSSSTLWPSTMMECQLGKGRRLTLNVVIIISVLQKNF